MPWISHEKNAMDNSNELSLKLKNARILCSRLKVLKNNE